MVAAAQHKARLALISSIVISMSAGPKILMSRSSLLVTYRTAGSFGGWFSPVPLQAGSRFAGSLPPEAIAVRNPVGLCTTWSPGFSRFVSSGDSSSSSWKGRLYDTHVPTTMFEKMIRASSVQFILCVVKTMQVCAGMCVIACRCACQGISGILFSGFRLRAVCVYLQWLRDLQ